MMGMRLGYAPALLGGLLLLAGRQISHDASAAKTNAETRPSQITWELKGVRLQYPAGWQEIKNPDFELMLVPGDRRSSTALESFITFDIPDLPPHLAFMIQMGLVERDYESDLKKTHPNLKLDSASDVKIPGATARLLQSSWRENGQSHDDVALLMIHSSGVYILDAQTDEKRLSATRAAFDAIRASLQWTK